MNSLYSRRFVLLMVLLIVLLAGSLSADAQQPATQPATTAPADQQPLSARVIAVQGSAEHASLGSDDWQPCKLDDEYPPETMLRTGVRSTVTLQVSAADTHTVMVIDSVSRTILSELFRTADKQRVRVGVGYGRVRAGVVEGGLKSDFTVDCPVATLSKRGTWNFGLFYERGTDRFEVFLHDQGLVDVLNRVTRERRELSPHERVTTAMRDWSVQAQMLRNVPVPDMLGQGDIEVAFNRLRQDGVRVINPEGGRLVLVDLSTSWAQQQFADLARSGLGPLPRSTGAGTLIRPEGYFGTGRADELIPLIIEANSPLGASGLAKPGHYLFRRAALEGWLAARAR